MSQTITEKILAAHAGLKNVHPGQLIETRVDLILANDVTAPNAGFASDTNCAVLLYADGRRAVLPLQSKDAMADAILDAVLPLLAANAVV